MHTTLSPATRAGSRRLMIILYAVAAFLYWIALYWYMPTLPVYVQSKSDNLALVGIVLSMYGLWQAVIRLPLGIAADWLRWRKPFIIIGITLAGLGAWVMGMADNVYSLMAGRAITGLAAGTWVPLVAVFSSLFPPQEVVRASAMLTFIGSAGRMLAASTTGTLNERGGYPLAFFLAAGAAVLAILIMLPIRERRLPSQRPSLGSVGHLITRRDVLLPSLLSAVSQYANWTATFGFMPILAKQLGASDVVQSLLMSMSLAVFLLGNLVATAVANRISPIRLVYLGFTLMSLGIGMAALAPSLLLLFIAQFCIGLAQGITYPVLMGMSIQYVSDAERTTAMGLHQAVYAIGMFSGPGVSGLLANALGIQPMLGITAFVCLIMGLIGVRRLSAGADQ